MSTLGILFNTQEHVESYLKSPYRPCVLCKTPDVRPHVNSLRKYIQDVDSHRVSGYNTLNASITAIENARVSDFDTLEHSINKANQKIAQIENKITETCPRARVNQLETHLHESDALVNQLETQLNASNTRVNQLETQLNASNVNIKLLEKQLGLEVNQLETYRHGSNERVNQLETRLNASNTRVNQLETQLDASNVNIKLLEKQLGSLFEKVETLMHELNQVKQQTPPEQQTPSKSHEIINIGYEVDQGLTELIESNIENTTSDHDMDEWGIIDNEQ
jgi:chromosome segregation ATPase